MPDETGNPDRPDLPDLGDNLASLAARARAGAHLPAAADLRERGDRRQQRRTIGAAAAAVLVVAGGGFWLTQEQGSDTAPALPPAATAPPKSTAPPGITSILAGARRVTFGVPGMTGAPALADDGGQVRAVAGDRSGWLLVPAGRQYRIRLADTDTCMTVVHDAAPGSVRMRACGTGDDQLFTVAREDDGNYSLFAGRRYVQVVDGTNALVPDLREGLTTTYVLTDAGPA